MPNLRRVSHDTDQQRCRRRGGWHGRQITHPCIPYTPPCLCRLVIAACVCVSTSSRGEFVCPVSKQHTRCLLLVLILHTHLLWVDRSCPRRPKVQRAIAEKRRGKFEVQPTSSTRTGDLCTAAVVYKDADMQQKSTKQDRFLSGLGYCIGLLV